MHNKNKMTEEDPEYGVDSRYTSKEERISDGITLMEERLKRMKNVTQDQIVHAKLMQIKLKKEFNLK